MKTLSSAPEGADSLQERAMQHPPMRRHHALKN
jgi:hypothetical protein